MFARQFRRLLFALPLLLLTEGHMSGTVSRLTLPDLVRRSDAIFVAKKAEPHVVTRTKRLGNKKGQDFTYTAYRYTIQSVVHARGEGVPTKGSIEVQDAADEDNARETLNQIQGRPTKILIYTTYAPETPKVDSLPEVLLFTRHSEAGKGFVFVARDAVEGPAMAAKVREILSARKGRPSQPPE